MANFKIEVSGSGSVESSLNSLQDRWSTDRVYVTGTNQEYAVALEFGRGPVEAQDADALRFEDENGDVIYRTSVSGHPPYPFFEPAIREFKANPINFITDNSGFDSIRQIPNGDVLVKTLAEALANQMSANASATGSADRSPGTHPNHPQRQSGALVASIQAVRVR
jgi:hypothetical protein